MKGKLIKGIITGIVVVGIGFGGIYCYNNYKTKNTVTTASQYITMTARTMNLQESVQGTGAAYAAVTKDVMTNNNGTLSDLSVKVGDTVTAGQKLFAADSDDVRNNVATAQNNLEKQNLALSQDENAAKVDDNKIAMDNLSISDAQDQLDNANKALNEMTVTAPIGGIVTAVNNSNGDSIQSGKAVLTIVDPNSIKVKVAVDELDIDNVKIGQKATLTFDAIKDKTFDGSVESVAETGTSSNNVTTYDVVVAVNNPAGIRLDMNANVNILVQSKDNVLAVPTEAVIDRNGQKYVRVEDTNSTTDNNQASVSITQGTNVAAQVTTNSGKLVAIKTGLETENYIEVTNGLTEGEKVLVQLPKTSSTTTNNKNSLTAGFGGGFAGGMGGSYGGNGGGQRSQGSSSGSGKE